MDFEVSYTLENEQQFWDELDDIVGSHCESIESIDNALRTYFSFATEYRREYLKTEYEVRECTQKLLRSHVFWTNKDYVRQQIVHSLPQEEVADTLYLIVAFLLHDGRTNDRTFEMMNEGGNFPRLVELIKDNGQDETDFHRLLMELVYEMSRMQRLRFEDLIIIEDDFIAYLLDVIESLASDVGDPYHYPVIKVLLILNEQFMVSTAGSDADSSPAAQLTNKVLKVLSLRGSGYKAFGENVILLLNRENETSLQLLILKILYLLFTTPSTQEYFYTNDLRVLVDIMIRNLLDLPYNAIALRHIYLRVLHPLLAHTQLKEEGNHYKKEQLQRLLGSVGGSWHFGEVDDTTARLVGRCWRVEWLKDGAPGDVPDLEITESPVTMTGEDNHHANGDQQSSQGTTSLDSGASTVAQHLLASGPHHNVGAMMSNLSVNEVAAQREKPGVKMPSRHHHHRQHIEESPKPTSEDQCNDGVKEESPAVLEQQQPQQRRPSRQGPPVAPRRKGKRKTDDSSGQSPRLG